MGHIRRVNWSGPFYLIWDVVRTKMRSSEIISQDNWPHQIQIGLRTLSLRLTNTDWLRAQLMPTLCRCWLYINRVKEIWNTKSTQILHLVQVSTYEQSLSWGDYIKMCGHVRVLTLIGRHPLDQLHCVVWLLGWLRHTPPPYPLNLDPDMRLWIPR